MKYVACLLLCWLAVVATASARMGETREQCNERYGQAVTNLDGWADLVGVGVHVKDGMVVSVFFVKTEDKMDERVGMIYYSRAWPFEYPDPRRKDRSTRVLTADITTNEQAALLATVPGRWEHYSTNETGLAGKSENVLPLTDYETPTEQHCEAAENAVRVACKALNCARGGSSSVIPVQAVAHKGPKLFAFRVGGGLALCSYNSAPVLKAWGHRWIAERTKVDRLRKDDLKGF